MKKTLLTAPLLLVFLAGCSGSSASARYGLTITLADAAKRPDLMAATLRVLERRVDALGAKLQNKSVQDADQPTVSIGVSDPKILPTLASQLTSPFTLRFMRQTRGKEKADITVEGHGGFKGTGITEKDILWVTAAKDPQSGKGVVVLEFSPSGRTLMEHVFAENKGSYVGLFVRGHLVSKLLVETDKVKDNIMIQNIPSAELAGVFADDVNVGTHVVFIPMK